MGIILSRFRRLPTTLEQLKNIEDGLRKIEDYKRVTEQKQKRTVANLVIYGVALYILACVIVFVWYLPESWLVRLALLVPLVLVPLIIYWMKRLISRYFESRMVRANEQYDDLQKKKKDLIDSIMETETFNKAKEILSRYAPEKLEKKESLVTSGPVVPKPSGDLRKRNPASANTASSNQQWLTAVEPQRKQTIQSLQLEPASAQSFTNLFPQLKLPQPLFAKNRSLGDKLVEYIVGDGPSYRYALICKFCREHNGMALQEEFPYMSFACCYCRKFNPARITRPIAPRLPQPDADENIETASTSSNRISDATTNEDQADSAVEKQGDLSDTEHPTKNNSENLDDCDKSNEEESDSNINENNCDNNIREELVNSAVSSDYTRVLPEQNSQEPMKNQAD